MNEQDELRNRLRELAESIPQNAGMDSEQRLLAAFRAHHTQRKWRRIYIAQAAGLVIASLALYFAFGHRANRPGSAQVSAAGSPNQYREALSGFVPLPYAQSGVPIGEAGVMRVQLAPSDFPVLGVSPPAGFRRQRVGADLLIGQDGIPRAVRFLP